MSIYKIEKNGILVTDKGEFNPTHILECGQVFCYSKIGDDYAVLPQNKFAKIIEKEQGYLIETADKDFFVRYFDLDRSYSQIKTRLSEFSILKKPIQFGSGIRILRQDLFETLISFIISSNNNIKRIKLILDRLRANLGDKTEYGYAFPTRKQMLSASQDFFKQIGAGYRAKYLFDVVRQIDDDTLSSWQNLATAQLRNKLISLAGVGPKVADCVLLFGYGRGDVFPVDTWIHQMYNTYYKPLDNREKIRQNLLAEFGDLSGYAQQYLFYYQRLAQ